ncbi:TM0106 family RecB-like putative nuclease [Chloroflexota bacterium]
MNTLITASMLYNLVQCPHRLNLDLYQDPSKRDPESKFVQLLWENGNAFERDVIECLDVPFVNLREFPDEEKVRRTREEIDQRTNLIYGGRIASDNLLGEPDLLRWNGTGYVAGDIKSGSGEVNDDDGEASRPKKHYAAQLALYTHILEKLEVSGGREPFVWDIHGKEVTYYLDAQQGPRTPQTLWEFYIETLTLADNIISKPNTTQPALASNCKLCHWHSHCTGEIVRRDDLSLIPELGRAKRDDMSPHFATVNDLAEADLSKYTQGNKTLIKGIGPGTLKKFQIRARLLCDPAATPILVTTPDLPDIEKEVFFDIEVDPMRDICYLHGFVERLGRLTQTERYVPFLSQAPRAEEEERSFSEAWQYVKSCQPCAIYYYSKYERTWWRKLQQRYPSVVKPEEIEAMFDPASAIDLYYDVVKKFTEWPTRDHSIKTLAKYLGFDWRDTSPSGVESIEWYHRWVDTADPSIRQRILDYNEDDCIATRILLDGIRNLGTH